MSVLVAERVEIWFTTHAHGRVRDRMGIDLAQATDEIRDAIRHRRCASTLPESIAPHHLAEASYDRLFVWDGDEARVYVVAAECRKGETVVVCRTGWAV